MAAVGIPLLLSLSVIGHIPFLILVLLAAFLGMTEFGKIASGNQVHIPRAFLGIAILAAIYFTYYDRWEILIGLCLFVLLALAVRALKQPLDQAAKSLAFSILGVVYLYLFAFWVLIRQLPAVRGYDYASGGHWMVSLFLIVWSCDTAAYFGGKGLGRHQLAPVISPSKTKEGAAFGLLGAIFAAVVIHYVFFVYLRLTDLLVVALLVAILGQLGDLFESLLKRSAQLKDTSTLIPGHGGVLDRFDSLLFVSPWVYLYLRWFVYKS